MIDAKNRAVPKIRDRSSKTTIKRKVELLFGKGILTG